MEGYYQRKIPFQIFISFTGKDTALKDALKKRLEELSSVSFSYDLKIWEMDADCYGKWDEACQAAIRSSNAFICLLTENVKPNSIVHKEIALACECAQKNLIVYPVLLTDDVKRVTEVDFSGYTTITSLPQNGTITFAEEAMRQLVTKLRSQMEQHLQRPQMKDVKDFADKPFAGRDAEIQQIEEAFSKGDKAIVLYGLGGIGKTELARQFVLRNKAKYPNAYIVEMDASDRTEEDGGAVNDETNSEVKRSLRDLILRLNFVGTPLTGDINEVYRYNLNALRNLPPTTIIIFDGYDVHLDAVEELDELVSNVQCEVIITSRQTSQKISTIEINALPPEDAKRAFRGYCTKRDISDDDLEKLLNSIDRHTLTIELVARLLETTNPKLVSTEMVLQSFFDVNSKIEREIRNNRKKMSRVDTVYRHVANVLNLSNFSTFKQGILAVLCRICRLGISEDELIELADITAETEYELQELVQASFVIKNNGTYSLHPIISEIAFRQIPLAEDTDIKVMDWLGKNALKLDKSKPILEKSTLPEYGEHYVCKRERKEGGKNYQIALSRIYHNTAYVHHHLAHFQKALEYNQKALAIRKKVLGTKHPDTASSYDNIGSVYSDLGEHKTALEYHRKALAIRKKKLGSEHPDTATSYNNIGFAYHALKEYKKALAYYKKALAIRKKKLGTEHPDTATSYDNIGTVHYALRKYKKALEYFQKALAIREKVLGTKHPDTATSYNNIGCVYCALREYKKAWEFFQKALAILEKVLGTEHPDTASSYDNIGSVYSDLGEHKEALEYYQKALAILEKVSGSEHPDTATSYNNIGFAYYALREYKEALEYCHKALTIYEKRLGTKHPHTIMCYKNLSDVYSELGDTEKAEEYRKKVSQE